MQTYMTLTETARLLGVDICTVRRMVDRGELEGIRDQRGIRFVATASAQAYAERLGRTGTGELFDTEEAAAALGVSPRTLAHWASAGLVPAVMHPSTGFRFEPAAFTALGRPVPPRPPRLRRRLEPRWQEEEE